MFEIYSFELMNGFIDKQTLHSYVPDYGLTENEYQEIVAEYDKNVGDSNENVEKGQETQA